jgi:hypothetical protein
MKPGCSRGRRRPCPHRLAVLRRFISYAMTTGRLSSARAMTMGL